MAGANIGQQFLIRGLIDEIVVHVVPVVFGSGRPLFGDLNSKHVRLEAAAISSRLLVGMLNIGVLELDG